MRRITRIISLILVFAMLVCVCTYAGAESEAETATETETETETKGTINYAVRAVLPENQLDNQASSFDLKVAPGQRQVLEVIIKNKGNEDIEVAVEANTAFTNENGLIEFDYSEDRDVSMAVDFGTIANPVESVVMVPAQGESIAEIYLEVPDEPFEGVVYGGLMFTKLYQGEEQDGEGMSIRNVYRYAIGVRLREDETDIEPAFELTGAKMDQTDSPVLYLYMRNPKPLIVRGMTLYAQVYKRNDDDAVMRFERNNIAIAPNSSFWYKVRLGESDLLEPGEYRVSVTLNFESKSWQLETPLIVN